MNAPAMPSAPVIGPRKTLIYLPAPLLADLDAEVARQGMRRGRSALIRQLVREGLARRADRTQTNASIPR